MAGMEKERDWDKEMAEVDRLLNKLPDTDPTLGRGGGGGGGTGHADFAAAPWMRVATFEEFKQAAERTYILAKLKEHDWNVSETARTLDMPRSNLYKKIERYGLAREA